MPRRRKFVSESQGNLQMTSMIDVVFLLLAFFVVTYKTPEVEGDFNIRMPVEAQSNQAPNLDEITPVTVKLTADADGKLSGISFGEAAVPDMNGLRGAVYRYVNRNEVSYRDALSKGGTPDFRDDLEIELDCDGNLRYRHAVEAITAVTGYLNSDDQIVKMVDRVKFSPPKKN